MRKISAFMVVVYFTLFMSVYHHTFAANPPGTEQLSETLNVEIEQLKQLLQKGLTIHEMEQEIARLTSKEIDIMNEIKALERETVEQESLVAATKKQAGKVLRSYYLGERDSLWLLLLSLNSISEAIAALEFISTILSSDQKKLNDYYAAEQQLQHLLQLAKETQVNLQLVKQQFVEQRDAQLALQQELDRELEARPDGEQIKEQISQLTTNWEEEGLPVFRLYLQAFADAMEHLPEIQSMYSNVLSLKGANILLTMTDEQLNGFLASQDPILEHMTFQFNDDQVQAGGQHEGIQMMITGQFSLELEPDNVIRFTINELFYNDFVLPETTVAHLQEQFAFSFYPEHISFLGLTFKATELIVESGQLTVKLSL